MIFVRLGESFSWFSFWDSLLTNSIECPQSFDKIEVRLIDFRFKFAACGCPLSACVRWVGLSDPSERTDRLGGALLSPKVRTVRTPALGRGRTVRPLLIRLRFLPGSPSVFLCPTRCCSVRSDRPDRVSFQEARLITRWLDRTVRPLLCPWSDCPVLVFCC